MQTSQELKTILLHIYEQISQSKTAPVLDYISHQDGIMVIGTETNEWMTSVAAITHSIKAQLEGGQRMEMVSTDLTAYSEGDTGWAADQPIFKFSDGSQTATRLTVVFHREIGQWKIVQWHLSVGVANS